MSSQYIEGQARRSPCASQGASQETESCPSTTAAFSTREQLLQFRASPVHPQRCEVRSEYQAGDLVSMEILKLTQSPLALE